MREIYCVTAHNLDAVVVRPRSCPRVCCSGMESAPRMDSEQRVAGVPLRATITLIGVLIDDHQPRARPSPNAEATGGWRAVQIAEVSPGRCAVVDLNDSEPSQRAILTSPAASVELPMLDWPGALYGELAVDMRSGHCRCAVAIAALIFEAFLADFRPDFLADLFYASLLWLSPFFAPSSSRPSCFGGRLFLPAALAAPFFFLAMVIPKSHGVVNTETDETRPIMRHARRGSTFFATAWRKNARVFRLVGSPPRLCSPCPTLGQE